MQNRISFNPLFIGCICLTVLTACISTKSTNEKDKAMKTTKTIFTFFAAPGAGKGTLAEQCKDKLGYQVLSTGDLCRKHIAQKTEFGKKLEEYTKSGGLVPDDIIVGMVKEWLNEQKNNTSSIILDGFPRTKVQAEQLLEFLKTDMPNTTFRIISLELPEQEIVDRLSGRRVCSNQECKAVYNISMPEIKNGKCPKCGKDLILRNDDKPEVIKERFKVYKANEKDLTDFYISAGKKIEFLNISGLSKEEVFEKFKEIA